MNRLPKLSDADLAAVEAKMKTRNYRRRVEKLVHQRNIGEQQLHSHHRPDACPDPRITEQPETEHGVPQRTAVEQIE